jgi:ABC-type phosphate transport system substrate-binding protein
MEKMYLIKQRTIISRLFFIILSVFLINMHTALAQETIGVIGNSKGVPNTLTMKELKGVLKGEKQRWGDGTKIVIALMKTNTPLGQTSAKKIYNMTGDELNRFWLALVFQGRASAPTFFNSMSELEAFVAQTPGAIGVVKKEASNESKLIPIDGKKEF